MRFMPRTLLALIVLLPACGAGPSEQVAKAGRYSTAKPLRAFIQMASLLIGWAN